MSEKRILRSMVELIVLVIGDGAVEGFVHSLVSDFRYRLVWPSWPRLHGAVWDIEWM